MTDKPTYEELEKRVLELERAEFECKQVERKLHKEINFNKTLIHASPTFYVAISSEGKTIMVNETMLHALGYKQEEVVGKDYMTTFVPERYRKELSGIFDKLVKFNRPTLNENYILTKEGKKLLVEWHGRPVFNEKNEFDYFIGVGIDRTERKQAEEALSEKTIMLDNILRSSTDMAIATTDLDFRITYYNPMAEKFFGYSAKEVIGKKVQEMHTKENVSPERFEQAIEEVRQNGKYNYFLEQQTPKGLRHLESRVSGIFDSKEKMTGFALFTQDITDRKRAEEALRESEKRFSKTFHANPNIVAITSLKDGRYIDVNASFIRILGYCREEIIGRTSHELKIWVDPIDREKLMQFIKKDKRGSLPEIKIRSKSGEIFNMIFGAQKIKLSGEECLITTAHDITERKQLEAQLQQARKMESIGTLAGGIAHDFNNLLYMITGNAELALDDTPEWNPVHDNLKEIKDAGMRAAGIVKQLLSFSRKIDQELKPIGAITVIKDALKFLRAMIPSTIQINTHLPDAHLPDTHLPDTDVSILADPVQINQVLMNICTNAAQAMEKTGGNLTINVEITSLTQNAADNSPDLSAGEYVKIVVTDTGPGIDPKIIDRIFDPYFTTKEIGKGSGMGLAVVAGIIKNHNGTITVDSQPGESTTFTMLFPSVMEKPEVEAKTSDVILPGNETILFVDDEEAIVNMIGQILARLGYTVETRLNPIDALALFKSKPDAFDLVITDMTMPQMTGAMLSEKLKNIRPDIPVIICTGHSSLINEEKAKELGIAAFVMKPIFKKEIATTIRQVLGD